MLETNGFNPIVLIQDEYDQEGPDITSLSDAIVDVLTFMDQEFNPMRESDAKVIAIIQNYEEQTQKISLEMSSYKKEIENLSYIVKKQKSDSLEQGYSKQEIPTPYSKGPINRGKKYSNEFGDQETTEKLKVLSSVITQLNLTSYTEVPNALNKIQQVMLTLPGIDKFVKQICEEIALSPSSRLDEILDTLKNMKKKLQALEKFKITITENFSSANELEIIEKIKGLSYFCRLFEVRQKDNIINVVEGIFYFVHEIKMFLAVIFI